MARRIALSALQQRHYLTGTGRYIAELFRELPALAPADHFDLYIKPDQSTLFTAAGPNARLRVLARCPSDPTRRSLWELLHFAGILRADGVDLYHGPANFLPPRKVCPYVLTLHDMVYFHNPERTNRWRALYWQWMIRGTWRLADLVLTASHFAKRQIQTYIPVPDDRIRIIPHGVEERFLRPAAAATRVAMRQAIGLDDPYILYVGRLDPDKNVATLVRAFALLRAGGLRGTRLVITGARDHRAGELPLLVDQLGLGDAVTFTGYVAEEHLPALYQEAAVFCYPSLNEGFGLPPLEAMAGGVPVVTSNLSSLPEVVGDAGAQVDPRSAEAIAAAIRRLLGTAEGRELGEAGRRRAAGFTWKAAAQQTLAAYEEVLARPRGARR